MLWQQLEYFRRVAQLQHFTKAAESLFISQPALSRSISKLEKELGVPLFERQGRSVKLNRYGKMFLEKVNLAMNILEEGKLELKNAIHPISGNISISFIYTLGTDLVPELISQYRLKYPNVTFQLFQNTANKIMEQLETTEIDVCLTMNPDYHPDIHCMPLFPEELFVIVPKTHPLAKRKEIKLIEIADEPFISFKKGVGLRVVADRLCREAGFVPNIMFESQEPGTVTGMVSAGLGVGLVPKNKGMENYNITCLRVTEPTCSRMIYIAWKKRAFTPKVAEHFRQFVIDYCSKRFAS